MTGDGAVDPFQLLHKRRPPYRDVEMGGLGAGPVERPGLAARTLRALRETFKGWDHYPTPDHWKGLEEIAGAIEAMAEGRAAPQFLYSSLPTGMGKSSTLLESVRQILASPAHRHVGIVIFVSRLEEIKRMIDELALEQGRFAVEVGKREENDELRVLGRGKFKGSRWIADTDNAQIVFATQQKLTAFATIPGKKDFKQLWPYLGKPRLVRVWDESIMPSKPLILKPDDIKAFADALERLGQAKPANELRDLVKQILDAAHLGARQFAFPMLDHFVTMTNPVKKLYEPDEVGDIISRMQGRNVRMFFDPGKGADGTMLTYRELLPKHLAPMLILDASGHLRVTYRAWSEGRGDLRKLYSPGKSYRNLTIHHWDRGAGKASMRNNDKRSELVGGAVKAIRSLPKRDRVLLVTHKPGKDYDDIVAEIKDEFERSGGDVERIEAVTWGRHTATNVFKDIRHAIVIGMHQYPDVVNEAYWRATAAVPADHDVDPKKIEQLRLGEIAHHLFQAAGRTAIRTCVDGDVPEGCSLWVVFAAYGHKAIPKGTLTRCFPGARGMAWRPQPAALVGGRLKSRNRIKFFNHLIERLGSEESVVFEADELWDFSSSMTFRFLRDQAIRAALEKEGLNLSSVLTKRDRTQVAIYTLRRL
ncbi:MAG: hypothetical protein ACKVP3_11090 [Hyphomicrobiaceae bacterium]